MSDINPYNAPQTWTPMPTESPVSDGKPIPASQGARFGNFFIDNLALFMLGAAEGVMIVVLMGDEGLELLEKTPGIVFSIPTTLAYYLILEGLTGRTLGKLVTGTKVVSADGSPPSAGQLLGRTFARMIPFEPFSFLGKEARGWHDTLPGTYVVKV